MKKLFIVGNWKSSKTWIEAKEWLEQFKNANLQIPNEKKVIVCPPFTLLAQMKSFIAEKSLPIKLGAQNVSSFDEGAYTGEISANQAAEFVEYSLVGHSERRRYFHETDEDVLAKIKQLLAYKIKPILCISDTSQLDSYLSKDRVILDNADDFIFVYEPPSAISGGGSFRPEDPETANKNAGEISEKIGRKVITLYGGSVNPDNAAELFGKENIDGGLPGQASLDTDKFVEIIKSF